MAIPIHTLDYTGTAATFSAPTTSQMVSSVTDRDTLAVMVGGTATTVSIVTPTTGFNAGAVADTSSGSFSNTTVPRFFKLDRRYRDPATGNVTIDFSQVTGVTACILRG